MFSSAAERRKHIVDFVTQTVISSEHETMPDRQSWKESENLFDGKQNWGEDAVNEDWHSRIFIHEFAPIVRDVAVAAQQQIFSRADFIQFVAGNSENREFASIVETLVRYYLDEVGFAKKFFEWCLGGGLYGIATWKCVVTQRKVLRPELVIEAIQKQEAKSIARGAADKRMAILPDSLEEIEKGLADAAAEILGGNKYSGPRVKPKQQLEFGMELSIPNPFNFFWSPDADDINNSPYHAERYHLDYVNLVPDFESGVLDKTMRRHLLNHSGAQPYGIYNSTDSYQTQKRRQRNQFTSPNAFFPKCEITEYFGPLCGKDGDLLEENCHFIIGNGKYLLKDGSNGYWDQKSPYLTAVFSRRPFKATGIGVADAAKTSQLLLNELASLFIDGLRMDNHRPMVVNTDMLQDPSQIESGIAPGALIKAMNGDARQVFSDLPKSTNTAPELFQTLEFLKLTGQKGSSVNTMTSNPASRARISAKEIETNEGRRNQSLNSLGMEIDLNGIEPLVDRIKRMIFQFAFSEDNVTLLEAKGVLTKSQYDFVSNMTLSERFTESMKNYKIEVRGFRASLERSQWLSRFTEWIQQLLQLPPQVQELIDWRRVVTDGTDAYGMKGSDWIRASDERDKAREENVFLEAGQMLSTLPTDDDLAHLPLHYDSLLKTGPVPSTAQHIMMHFAAAQSKGLRIPPPPPEVAGLLGLPPPPGPEQIAQEKAVSRIHEQDEESSGPVH